MIWLDAFLEVHTLEVVSVIGLILAVWVVLLERKRQQLQEKLEQERASMEMWKRTAESWAREPQGQPTTIPCESLIYMTGDTAIVLAEMCLN